MELDTIDYLKLAASSALVSTVISFIFTVLRDSREQRKEGKVHALDAAIALEQYAVRCVRMVQDAGLANAEAGRQHRYEPLYSVVMPSFGLPTTIGWKYIDSASAAELKSFPNMLLAASRRIDIAANDEGSEPFGVLEEKCLEAAQLGVRALTLATSVRSNFSLPPARMNDHGEDPAIELSTEITRYRDRKSNAEKAARERFEKTGSYF